MRRFLRYLEWFVIVTLGIGVMALLAVMFWLPPNDPDSFALVRERTSRLAAYRLKRPLPGSAAIQGALDQRLAQGGFKLGAPILLRIYKLTFELEVWMQRDNQYVRFATYPICYFSGQLGPKMRFGDWQSPEGFYMVAKGQLNAFSAHHRALDLGFPNTYDKSHSRTGDLLEIHGGCSSIGCYAITNGAIDDVYRLAVAALQAGEAGIQVQALPFRMTTETLAAHAQRPQSEFWQELKSVADVLDDTHQPPNVVVCDGHYKVAGRTGDKAATNGDGCRKI